MNSTTSISTKERLAPWVNLVLPGGGLILAGAPGTGLLLGLLCTVCANSAIAATLLFPDDFPRGVQVLAIVLAAATYVGTQVRLVTDVRTQRHRQRTGRRTQLLREAQEALARGDLVHAREAVEALASGAAHDLLVAYRLAEVRTAAGDAPAARAAWRQVRMLDVHGIYRPKLRDAERTLGRL